MDGQLLRWLYHRLTRDDTARRTRRCVYPDAVVALAGLWACLNNRSTRWAADPDHWPLWCRRPMPSYSQLRRRLLTPSVATLLRRVDAGLRERLGSSGHAAVDGMPLTVARHSRDRDATRGHARGGPARGYKLHAVRDGVTGVISAGQVTGLHAGESTVARRLLRRMGRAPTALRADANYDAFRLYGEAAGRGGRLIAPRRKPGTGLGHHPQHPDRLRAIEDLERRHGGRREHAGRRGDIERGFADLHQTVGLFALPPFVRRLPRVRRWVRAKLLLYHLILVVRRVKA